MDNEHITAIIAVLFAAAGWPKRHFGVTDKLNFYG